MFRLYYNHPQKCPFCHYVYATTDEGYTHMLTYHQLELEVTAQGQRMRRNGLLFLAALTLVCALLLFILAQAFADTTFEEDVLRLCLTQAEIERLIAVDRDAVIPKKQVRQMYRTFVDVGTQMTTERQQIIRWLDTAIDLIYAFPKQTPTQVHALALQVCLDGYQSARRE